MSGWIIRFLRAHLRAFGEAGRYLGAAPLSSLLAVVAIGIALALPAGGRWALDNVEKLGRPLGDTHEISIFLQPDASRTDAEEVEKRLKNAPSAHWRFVGKEAALVNLQKQEGLQSLTTGLTRNPLPDAFVVRPDDVSPRALQEFAQHARTWPKVAAVQHDDAWAARYQGFLRLGKMAVALLAGVLAVALVAVTYNVIRLQMLARRPEIEVALLIGATRHWIARPFLWFGLIEGLLGAFAAIFLLVAADILLAPLVGDIARAYGSAYRLTLPERNLLLAVLAAGSALGWLGAWFSARQLGKIGPNTSGH
jgi:cell division transport system permease protein